MLIGAQRKSAAQAHHSRGVVFGKNGGNTAAAAFWLGQGARDFLPDDDTPERRRHYGFNGGVREKGRERPTKLFRVERILQHQGALHIGAAVQPAGQFKMSVADGSGDLEQAQQLFVLEHKSLAARKVFRQTADGDKRRMVSSLAAAWCVVNRCERLLDCQVRAVGTAPNTALLSTIW